MYTRFTSFKCKSNSVDMETTSIMSIFVDKGSTFTILADRCQIPDIDIESQESTNAIKE